MNTAYQNMRAFWLDARNVETKRGLLELGPDKIISAGVEMALADANRIKHLMVATNSLGDSSLYFENNSKSGLGGMIGGHTNEKLQETAARMLAHTSKLTGQMTKISTGEQLPAAMQAGQVVLWAVSKTNLFYIQMPEAQARNPENPFYPLFAYSQQLLGLFQAQSQHQPPAQA